MDIEKLEPNRFGGMEDSEGGRFTRTRDLLAVIAERDAALSRAEAAERENSVIRGEAAMGQEQLRTTLLAAEAEVARLTQCLAMADRSDAYKRYQDEIAMLETEVARLTDCLKTANGHHEHFERRWYLCQDRIAELEAEGE